MRRFHGGDARLGLLRHALALAPEVQREILVNRMAVLRFAAKYGLERDQVQFAVNLLRWAAKAEATLSPERLALIVMQDADLNDEDVGEIFGRSTRWATLVREQAEEIKAEQPIPPELDHSDAFFWPRSVGHAEREAETRARLAASGNRERPQSPRPVLIRNYTWCDHAFVPLSS